MIKTAQALLLLSLGLGLAGTACSLNVTIPDPPGPTSSPIRQESLDQPFRLKFGESAAIPSEKLRLTFTQLVQDSRCPSDVQCIRAGDVTVRVRLEKDGTAPVEAELSLGADTPGRDSVRAGDYTLRLTEVLPASKTSTQTLQPADYTITLIVSRG